MASGGAGSGRNNEPPMRPRGRSNSGDERDLPRIGKQACSYVALALASHHPEHGRILQEVCMSFHFKQRCLRAYRMADIWVLPLAGG